MARVTLKSSTIFISVGDKTSVYRSVDEVPPRLRKKLEQSTNGINSATILIADRRGRQEIARAIRGLPSSVRPSNIPQGEESERRSRTIVRSSPLEIFTTFLKKHWAEILIPPTVGVVVWFLTTLK